SFGLFGEDEYAPAADSTIFYSGADSIQSIRHLNSTREVQRLQKIVLKDRERRRRSADVVALEFDAKLSEHRAKFSPKIRDVNILERSLNTVTISPRYAPTPTASSVIKEIGDENTPERSKGSVLTNTFEAPKSSPLIVSKPQLISSTPLPTTSLKDFSFSNPSTSTLSPIPNIDNIPRFRDSLATPLFKNPEPAKIVQFAPQVKDSSKIPTARNLHDALVKSRLGSVEEEQPEMVKHDVNDRPTSTSGTRSSTRPSSPSVEAPSTMKTMKTNSLTQDNSPPRQEEWSLSNIYYSDVMIELKSYLDDARIFEARSGLSSRSLIKRSVLEKVTVTSKRHATTTEKDSTCSFFARLLSMEDVDGFNNEKLRLREKTSVHYAMTLIVEHYLSLLERDSPLVDTISYVLYSLSIRCPSFSTFLTASLLSRSACLDMDKSRCRYLVDGIVAEPQSLVDVMTREKAVCSLFYGLHSWSSKNPSKDSPYPLSSIWRIVACSLNRVPLLLATPFALTELLKACGTELQTRYGRQMGKMTGVIQDKLLPQLERDLEMNQESRRAGNAAYISALRSTIDLLIIS
ncbi:hypothetical protein PENTCL1PPCAC_17453, partial [Pristionchus entomophagus]